MDTPREENLTALAPEPPHLQQLRASLMGRTATAAKLRVDKKTLDRWRKNRVGPPWVELAGKIFYRDAAVVMWLLAQERRSVESNSDRSAPVRKRRRLRVLQGETVT